MCVLECMFVFKEKTFQLLTGSFVPIFRRTVLYAWLCMERCRGNDHAANHEQLMGDLGQA